MIHLPQDNMLMEGVKMNKISWIVSVVAGLFLIVMLMGQAIEWGKRDIFKKVAKGVIVIDQSSYLGTEDIAKDIEAAGYYCPNKKSNPRVWLRK